MNYIIDRWELKRQMWLKDQAHHSKNSFMTSILSVYMKVGGQTHTISDPPLQHTDLLTVFCLFGFDIQAFLSEIWSLLKICSYVYKLQAEESEFCHHLVFWTPTVIYIFKSLVYLICFFLYILCQDCEKILP